MSNEKTGNRARRGRPSAKASGHKRAKAARSTDAHSPRKPLPTPSTQRWSQQVTAGSDALDLENHVFQSGSAVHIARSLKHSADVSKRRKGTSYQSAMSMLNFYINRAGHQLPARRKAVLERAKQELRKAYGRA